MRGAYIRGLISGAYNWRLIPGGLYRGPYIPGAYTRGLLSGGLISGGLIAG